MNAGIMWSTPVCARKNSKWPKEWECDWDSCEASAAAMLGIQNIPVRFPIAKIMKQIVGDETEEEYCEDSLKLSMNFDFEELPTSVKFQNMGCCVACGNCLAGCPYNVKNSTDKNYLLSAIQANSL